MGYEYKRRQAQFHRLNGPNKQFNGSGVIHLDTPPNVLIAHIIDYFTIPISELIYPAKSYVDAIIYAKMIEQHFDVHFYEALNDPTLRGNHDVDPFFVPYNRAKNIYDPVIEYLKDAGYRSDLPQIKRTTDHFLREFYLNDETQSQGYRRAKNLS